MTGLDVLPDVLATLARVGLLVLTVGAWAYVLTDYAEHRARADRKPRTPEVDR